jgi:hypothetical protein
MTKEERRAVHDRWAAKPPHLEPGTPEHRIYENGQQCGGCAFFIPLTSDLGLDWGACANSKSFHDGAVTFEHFTCLQHEFRPAPEEVP